MEEEISARSGPGPRKGRNAIAAEDGGDPSGCSGKQWKSIAAGMIADCVALCCCPCAVVNLLTLALVKVPWKLGRRCLGIGKRRRKREKNGSGCVLVERAKKAAAGGGMVEVPPEFGGGWEESRGGESSDLESEKVWSELNRIGHLGFGRVSSSGGEGQFGKKKSVADVI